jgi:predicted permease
MTGMRLEWLRRLWRRNRLDADIDEEIRFHLAEEAQLRRDRGEAPERARGAARRDFGNVVLIKERTRDMWGSRWLDDFARDARYAVRGLQRSPALALVAILSLALGIGANTAIFSLADAVLFRPLPVRDPERLMQVRAVHAGGVRQTFSFPLYRDFRDQNQTLESTAAAMAGTTNEPVALEISGTPRHTHARMTVVTGNYFSTLGVGTARGRALTLDDDQVRGGHPVAVISHRFWTQALESADAAIGTRLLHNGIAYTIVGVAREGFTGISSNDDPDVWVPAAMFEAVTIRPGVLDARGSSSLYLFGRLKAGVVPAAAADDMARVFADIQRLHPEENKPRGDAISMARGVQALRERFERPLLVLLGIVGLLLLIACFNLAALLLARATARRSEIAMRLSLGASRSRLVRQLLTESALLAVIGCAVGLVLARAAASLLVELVTTNRRLPIAFTLDYRVLLFTGAVTAIAVLAFGLFPALHATRTRLSEAVAASGRTAARLKGGRLLIASQMALSLFLLIGAGLFIRSLANLRQLDTGFVRDNVMVVMMDPRVAYGPDPAKHLPLYRDLPARVQQLPGVQMASFSDVSFFSGNGSQGNIAYEGYAQRVARAEYPFKLRISPPFPETVGLPLVAGRLFTDTDGREAPRVALVSESISRRYFATSDAVGQRLCFSDRFAADCAIAIVGVVKDVRYSSLRESSPYTVYLPVLQDPRNRGDLIVRTAGDPNVMMGAVLDEVRRFNPEIRIVRTTTLDRLVDESIVQDRLLATLSAWFASVALLLAMIGLYGLTSYAVRRRTNEIGIRMALGAPGSAVRWLVLREVLALTIGGALVGVPAAIAASRFVGSLLFDVTPTDAATVAGATLTLIAIALLAGALPARRAAKVDPLVALRSE